MYMSDLHQCLILHNDNARIVTIINILIIYLCSFGIDVATPSDSLIKLNVIVLQVEQEAFTRELVQLSINEAPTTIS